MKPKYLATLDNIYVDLRMSEKNGFLFQRGKENVNNKQMPEFIGLPNGLSN